MAQNTPNNFIEQNKNINKNELAINIRAPARHVSEIKVVIIK